MDYLDFKEGEVIRVNRVLLHLQLLEVVQAHKDVLVKRVTAE
jgi:hypothetical protein